MKKTAVIGIIAVLVLAGAYFGVTRHLEGQIKEQVDKQLDQYRAQSKLDIVYGGLSVDIFAKSATLSNVTVASGKNTVTADSLILYAVEDMDNNLDIEARGIDLASQSDAPWSDGSFPKPEKAHMRVNYTFTPAAKIADLRKFRFAVPNYGDLEVMAVIGDPPSQAAADNPVRLLMEVNDAKIHKFSIKYADKGLLRQALAQEAKRTGGDAQTVLAGYDEQLNAKIAKYEELGSKEMTGLLKTVKKFAHELGGIEISANPEKPVKIGGLPQSETEAAAVLRLSANTF